MSKIIDVAYSNVYLFEEIFTDIFVLFVGFGIPLVFFVLCLSIVVSLIFIIWDTFYDWWKERLRKKGSPILDNGDITPS